MDPRPLPPAPTPEPPRKAGALPPAPPAIAPAHGRPPRSDVRRFVGLLVIGTSVALLSGHTLRTPALLEVNDISRWCTVWSLLERGTYAIDDCPWQHRTQDKVKRRDSIEPPGDGASTLEKIEYRMAPPSWRGGEGTIRTYSSKPPLLPTAIAGVLYPFRKLSGVPLDAVTKSEARHPRNVEEAVTVWPGVPVVIVRTQPPGPPVEWPAHVYYFKPILFLFNVVPYAIGLVLFARFLDRHARNDWAWFFGLTAAAFGTYLFAFSPTLNNHTVAAWATLYAMYALVRITADGERRWRYFLIAGFFAAFAATTELPAALLLVLLSLVLFAVSPVRTLAWFLPAALVPLVAFLATQMAAFGQFTPVYEEFGTQSYNYQLSYWLTPLEFDHFNKEPEPVGVYLLHMTFGHHGLFSLTPIALLALWGVGVNLADGKRRMRIVALLSFLLVAAMLAFYAWNPKARNYGGSTQGLRWLFWVTPCWLLMLPAAIEAGQNRKWVRVVAMIALFISVLSVGFALRHPWSHPWGVELLERLNLYQLRR